MQLLRRTGSTLIGALCALLSSTPLQAQFDAGFEQPTYTSGGLVGQDSWAGGTAPRVQAQAELDTELTNAGLNPATSVHGGSQALIVTGTGGSSSTSRPVSGLASSTIATLDVWARPLTPGSDGSTVGVNLGNIFMTMEDADGHRAAAIRFGATTDNGQITSTSIDAYSGGWQPSGISWQADTWYNLKMVADYSALTYDVFVDSLQVFDDLPFYASTSDNLSQIRIFRGSGQAGMIVDDLSVAVPEPATLALCGLAGCLLVGIRRR